MQTVDNSQSVQGVVGEVYTTPTGDTFAELPNDDSDGEYLQGWMQISEGTRVEVWRKRISHSTCVWCPV